MCLESTLNPGCQNKKEWSKRKELRSVEQPQTNTKEDAGHQMPEQLWQLSSSVLHASEGKHVDMVSQSCQQHIPAGAGVVVGGAHSSSQCATQVAKIAGLVGHPPMHADNEPPGQPLGTGLGGGAGAAVVVAGAGQSCLHTAMQASYASPVTTEHAASHAIRDPPGQSPEGDGGAGGAGGGLGGCGDGGLGGTLGLVVSRSPTFKFKKE
jgi:hypothetical protein